MLLETEILSVDSFTADSFIAAASKERQMLSCWGYLCIEYVYEANKKSICITV